MRTLKRTASRLWRSLRSKTVVIAGRSTENPTNTNTWSLYTFKTLTFRDYKTCLIDKDLSVLVISGEVPHETLLERWEEIQEEVSITLGGDLHDKLKGVFLVETLNSKINRLSETLWLFINEPIVELVEVFENEGWKYDRKRISQDTFAYVQYIRNKIGNLEYKFKIEKNKYDTEEVQEPTNEMYENIMAEISKFEGYPVPDTITMPRFCSHYKRLEKHAQSLKNGNRANRQLS